MQRLLFGWWGLIEEKNNLLKYRSRIHERKISLRFSGIILRVLRLEVSVCNVYITNQFQTTFAPLVEVTVNSKDEKTLKTFVSITSKNSASDQEKVRKKCAVYGYCQTAWKPYAACKRKALCMCMPYCITGCQRLKEKYLRM